MFFQLQAQRKASGGIAVFVHDSLRPGVCKVPLTGTETVILKLKSEFFNLPNDVFLVFRYCVLPLAMS